MYTVSIETQLHALRPGDRVRYSGVDWDIKDYSTYQGFAEKVEKTLRKIEWVVKQK